LTTKFLTFSSYETIFNFFLRSAPIAAHRLHLALAIAQINESVTRLGARPQQSETPSVRSGQVALRRRTTDPLAGKRLDSMPFVRQNHQSTSAQGGNLGIGMLMYQSNCNINTNFLGFSTSR
jgi:hypothetical protein